MNQKALYSKKEYWAFLHYQKFNLTTRLIYYTLMTIETEIIFENICLESRMVFIAEIRKQ